MGARERTSPTPPRESEMERAFESCFKEYEEWRSRQTTTGAEQRAAGKGDDKKKQPFVTKLDLLFVVLGFILALTFGRGCSGGQ